MIARIMLVFALTLGLFAGTADAKKQKGAIVTPSATTCSWKRDNDRTYVCDMTHKKLGRIHAVLWYSPKGHIEFTAIMRCAEDPRADQRMTWKEGNSFAHGTGCSGRPMGQELPDNLEEQLHPLPRAIEVNRVKPPPRILPAEKLT